jgi:spoIIIJ-associated protein
MLSPEELSRCACESTEGLLKAMGFEAKVSAKAEGENVDVTAEIPEGEDLLTGRKGEVRQALQHLLDRMINRGDAPRYHLQLEINDFWRKREVELEELARGMANDAVNDSRELLTEYLNAQERRVIHVTLRDDARVKTYAIGDGLIKKLAVAPAGHEGGGEDGLDPARFVMKRRSRSRDRRSCLGSVVRSGFCASSAAINDRSL